ncbi:multidrug resistance-associated protein 1 [Thraustotheca clavata]|uniref:Multidrug resistance-associated protein 1 n=1 Tax=Thraustotheca clavata TaxID=74557 RepID=A0A1V9ZQQ9_9STRA|nr:multidrug resistance-associated protein 1 [Thraustotheca clavata]
MVKLSVKNMLQGEERGAKYSTFEPVPAEDLPAAHPLDEAGFLSRFVFAWTKPLLRLGHKRALNVEDLWRLQSANKVQPLTKHFAQVYEKKNKGILAAFFSIYWGRFTLIGIMQFFSVACDLYGPGYVLGQFIKAVEAPILDTTYVFQLIGSLYAAHIVNAFVKSHLTYMNETIGIQFSSALRCMLFEKALKLSAQSRKDQSPADIVNLFSVDTINVMTFATNIHQAWIVPLQITFVLYLLYTSVFWSIFVGLGVVFFILIVNAVVAILMGTEQERCFKLKDDRMKVINDVFGAIQIIKFNAWEERFLAKIRQLRQIELNSIWKLMRIILILISFMNCTPILVTVAVFATFTLWMHQALTVTIVFTTLALFKSLQDALVNLPIVIMSMVQSLVSAKRINDILLLEECDPDNIATGTDPIAKTYAKDKIVLAVSDGSFGWDQDTPIFQNINLRIKKGELVVVHGNSGQGKSSLCTVFFGAMEKFGGTVFVGGSVAYFAQQSWIQNTTIRENILFGHPYDRTKYQKVVDACALSSDLQSLPSGDRTEIGQKGINLSASQKIRISLARACYSDADVFILDSPLDSLDPNTTNEIFTKCILGLLKYKTVLLVSQKAELIESASVNRTLFVQSGRVIETTNDKPRLLQATLISPLPDRKAYWEQPPTETIEYPVNPNDTMGSPSLLSPFNFSSHGTIYTPPSEGSMYSYEESAALLPEEEGDNLVSRPVVSSYSRYIGGCPAIFTILLLTITMQVFKVGSDLWLTQWSNKSENEDTAAFTATSKNNMAIYAGLALCSCGMIGLQTYSVIAFGLRGSQRMFDAMLKSLLEAPLRFFDANPLGRILHRFGDDVVACDFSIPFTLGPILFETSSAFFTIGTTLVLTQWLGLVVLPLLFVYYRLGAFFLAPLREVNRLQKTTRTPFLSFVSEGIDGAGTIRGFGEKQVRRFCRLNTQKIEIVCEARVASCAINVWFAMRMQLLSSTIVAMILTALVLMNKHLSPGVIGLLVTYGLSVPANLMYLVNMWSQLETSMVSPERLHDYIRLEKEGIRETLEPEDWPSAGKIEFYDVAFQYKPNDALSLKNVTFRIDGGEKIGVVGRTGAGKSSLVMALFRMNDVASGRILIDDVDIATIGVKTLRDHLAIIPQNPILFKGTLRGYLDPFDEFGDDQLWGALRKVKMAGRVLSFDAKLQGNIEENGSNFTVGERQLLCMARALLRQVKIVVLDEATATVDLEADKVLQTVIKEELVASTVLTIAHRLNSVLDYDRIMAFDRGELVQCGSPKKLIRDRLGVFFELVSEGGLLDKFPSMLPPRTIGRSTSSVSSAGGPRSYLRSSTSLPRSSSTVSRSTISRSLSTM